ncbi:carotenoid oxygenase family protein [Coleofasciculus sp. FACHB-1120]|uniref:carotenoid oxygenase family protein n=1 Tax=Coleofasciculus sp. FACHB-1120 TaxID=2692783 RepID=UPI0018F05A0E|nr:carotenoid oxygenase family protein [Coleofasciculus sp. FACHB-1120]
MKEPILDPIQAVPGCCPPVPESIMTANRYELSDIKMQIRGELPDDLQGHIFIVAPVGSVNSGDAPDADGTSLLGGDGMIYRLDFDRQGEVGLKTRLVKPPCYYADKATRPGSQYAKYQFRNHGISRFSLSLGFRNELNTAFLPIKFRDDANERLLVTYDAGRPYEIDTETLEVVTPIGANTEWRSETSLKFPLPPVLSTAHPVFDPEKSEMFTVNYGKSVGNLLETIPFIYDLDELPEQVEELLKQLARFIEAQDFVQDFLKAFSTISEEILEFYMRLLERTTNIEFKDFVYLIRWDGGNNLERWKLVLPDKTPVKIKQTIHQIGVTKDYVILMDTAFTTGVEQLLNNPIPKSRATKRLIRDLLTHRELADSVVYIVRRADLKVGQRPACSQQEVEVVARRIVIPLEAAHFLVDYPNPDGHITLHASHICAWDVSEWLREYDVSAYNPKISVPPRLCGMQHNEMDISRMGRYVIDGESGQILESKLISDAECTWGVGLYAYCNTLSEQPTKPLDNIYWISFGLWKQLLTQFVFDLYKDYKYRLVPRAEMLRLAEAGIPASLFRLNTSANESLKIGDRYQFPAGYIVSSPQFMPRRDSKDSSTDGYIVCTVFTPDGSEIWIFDAQNLTHGPRCRLSHPSLKFSLTIHTAWLQQIAPRTAKYNIPVRQDYKDLVKQQSPEIQELFETEVYPHFEPVSRSPC